jgi:hypothetical protein
VIHRNPFAEPTCQCDWCREERCRFALAWALYAGDIDEDDIVRFDEFIHMPAASPALH